MQLGNHIVCVSLSQLCRFGQVEVADLYLTKGPKDRRRIACSSNAVLVSAPFGAPGFHPQPRSRVRRYSREKQLKALGRLEDAAEWGPGRQPLGLESSSNTVPLEVLLGFFSERSVAFSLPEN